MGERSLDTTLESLREPQTIRARCRRIVEAALRGELTHFSIDLEKMGTVADRVVAVTKAAYPQLEIPRHSRMNHFRAGGRDRIAHLTPLLPSDLVEQAKSLVELVVVSVLLDAGAGPAWRYVCPQDGEQYIRSEGLAVASLDAFASGLFSGVANDPLRADAPGLANFNPTQLRHQFQATDGNALRGLEGRVALLQRLGQRVAEAPEFFGRDARVGGLVERLLETATNGEISATVLLPFLLDALGPIWPARSQCEGKELGDVWRHPHAGGDGASRGWLPFHKLSQWLCYSLVELLEMAGLKVTEEHELTGLAEYRNGGLFVDSGVLAPIDPVAAIRDHKSGSEFVVEWRALTVGLLDRLAPLVNARLFPDGRKLSLAAMLEGGTWAAGRQIASELRAGATPPFKIQSDGTLF